MFPAPHNFLFAFSVLFIHGSQSICWGASEIFA